MGKLTISMAIFNSYVKLPEGNMIDLSEIIPKLKIEANHGPWNTLSSFHPKINL